MALKRNKNRILRLIYTIVHWPLYIVVPLNVLQLIFLLVFSNYLILSDIEEVHQRNHENLDKAKFAAESLNQLMQEYSEMETSLLPLQQLVLEQQVIVQQLKHEVIQFVSADEPSIKPLEKAMDGLIVHHEQIKASWSMKHAADSLKDTESSIEMMKDIFDELSLIRNPRDLVQLEKDSRDAVEILVKTMDRLSSALNSEVSMINKRVLQNSDRVLQSNKIAASNTEKVDTLLALLVEKMLITSGIVFVFVIGLQIAFLLVLRYRLNILVKGTEIAADVLSFRFRTISKDQMGKLAQAFNHSLEHLENQLNEMRDLKDTFQKFVPQQFLNRVTTENNRFDLSNIGNAEAENATVLFSDIRDFTEFSESLTPEELFAFLNSYLQRMTGPIHRNTGIIDKFIGDAMMVIFNDTESNGNSRELNAVNSAIAIHEALISYNRDRTQSGFVPISMGIGIHSGPVVMGTVGSQDRMDFTVIGDTVNLASRLESLTKFYNVSTIASERVVASVKNSTNYLWRELDTVLVKGKTVNTVIYELIDGLDSEAFDQKTLVLPHFCEGIESYKKKDWKTGAACFKQCLKLFPEDNVSHLYLQRCQKYEEQPPAEDWTHIFVFGEK
ncbi:MAG: hypothetical protein HQM13_13565 [SAR324 cluster bacterium]|nr:hypothetical protein [SAR324 cluster bacterium]